MSGNVREWCHDWMDSYTPYDETNPTGPTSGTYRVNRGGSWNDIGGFCRVTYRGSASPSTKNNRIGLRLAM